MVPFELAALALAVMYLHSVPASAAASGTAVVESPALADSLNRMHGLVGVRAGRFIAGSPRFELYRYIDEEIHEVKLTRDFLLLDHEVTQAEWRRVMGWNESHFRGEQRPVEEVTWFDAVDFCNRCSVREKLEPAYVVKLLEEEGVHILQAEVIWNREANGYRLPTEAEWEYACRAGGQSAFSNGRSVHCCRQFDPGVAGVAWYAGNANDGTHRVKEKSPNDWGLYDMHGNVWEWCWDWYAEYPLDSVNDPIGPKLGTLRTTRGGSWLSYARLCRSAYRGSVNPSQSENYLGLRLARNAG